MAFGALKNLFKEDVEDEEELYEPEDYDDVEEEPKASKRKRGGLFSKKDDLEDLYKEDVYESKNDNVVPIRTTRTKQMEVVVIKPNSINDGEEITKTLLSGRAVILNLEGIDYNLSQRIIDYSAGTCCAIDGKFHSITNFIYIVTPKDVQLSGDFEKAMGMFGETAIDSNPVSSMAAGSKYEYKF